MDEVALNELVYVRGIGYGTLVDCPNSKTIPRLKSSESAQSSEQMVPLFEQPSAEPSPPLQPQIATVRLTHCQALVYTPSSNLRVTVQLSVKTFIGNRDQLKVQVPVECSVDALKKLVFEKLGKDITHFYHIRLFHPTVELRELTKTLLLEQLAENSKLVLLAQQTFSLGILPNALGLKLSRNNLCLTKTGDQNYSSAVGNAPLEHDGRYYWEVRLDNFAEEDDLYIGVADKGINGQACPTHAGPYWGYMPLYAKRFSGEQTGSLIDYGYAHKIGDVVGALLTIRKGVGELSFYRGVSSCGRAFENIKVPVWPVFSLLGSPGSIIQITVDPRAAQPPYD